MVISGQEYFELCHQRFLQKASEDTCSDSFIRVGGRLTVRIKFAGKHLVSPFMRALAHLSTSEVESPELTVCIWDDPSSSRNLLLYPFSGDIEKTKRHKAGNIEIACELWPQRLSLFSAERKLALFWVNDVNEYPWYERCRPLRYIIHWWALQHKLYLVHAACIGTAGGGLLVTGRKGAGKSTTALSSLDSDLSYLADDLCLIGFEGKQVFAYSLYNTAKLDNFEKLPGLEKHVHNRHRVPGEKAILYVHDRFPDKLLLKVPVLACGNVAAAIDGRADDQRGRADDRLVAADAALHRARGTARAASLAPAATASTAPSSCSACGRCASCSTRFGFGLAELGFARRLRSEPRLRARGRRLVRDRARASGLRRPRRLAALGAGEAPGADRRRRPTPTNWRPHDTTRHAHRRGLQGRRSRRSPSSAARRSGSPSTRCPA